MHDHKATHKGATAKLLICDFCATPNPTRSYECVPFVMIVICNIEQWSDNLWAACDGCAKLIDTDQWDALTLHSLNTFPMLLSAKEREGHLQYLKSLHQKFRQGKGQVA